MMVMADEFRFLVYGLGRFSLNNLCDLDTP